MLSGEVECLVEDLQAKQEQGTQALSGVARHQPVHLQPGERFKGGSKVFVEGIRDSSGKISKTEEVVREEQK